VDDPKPPQVRGREIRYQAAQALARRGSAQVQERIPLLLEMLDENELMRLFRVKLKNQSEGPDTAIIGVIIKKTLHGISDLHAKNPDVDVSPFVPAIEKLKTSENQELRLEAERTLSVLNPK
jgi:hypothetical protein